MARRRPLESRDPGSNPGPPVPSVCPRCEHVFVWLPRVPGTQSRKRERRWRAPFPTRRRFARWECARAAGVPKLCVLRSLRAPRGPRKAARKPLEEVMVENSTFNRGHLKARLYEEGLKERRCELCGQGELWQGRLMALILDHINGNGRDHRLENLRIVCPNCAATLDTHCGRNVLMIEPRVCAERGSEFRPRAVAQRFCGLSCGQHHEQWIRWYERDSGAEAA